MKTVALFTLITALSFMSLTQGNTRVLWFADFELPGKTHSFPKRVNTPDNWNLNVENPGTVWRTTTRGNSRALMQTAEGCVTSGNTPIPSSPQFSDGFIDLEMSWGDDDSVGVTFRATWGNNKGVLGGEDSWGTGYLVVFGYNETIALMLHDMAKGCTEPGHCLNNDPAVQERENNNHCDLGGTRAAIGLVRLDWKRVDFEVGGVKAGIVEGGRGAMPQDNKHILFGRIRAIGNQIDIWYGEVDKVNPETIDGGLEPMMSVTDDKYQTGEVGIWHESWKDGIIDNLIIANKGGIQEGFSVDAKGKLATVWGATKAAY